MKIQFILIYIFFIFATLNQINAQNKYLDLYKRNEEKFSIVCLAEIEYISVFEVLKKDFIGFRYYPALAINIEKFYKTDTNISKGLILIPFIQSTKHIAEFDDVSFFNDLSDKIEFKRKILLAIDYSKNFDMYFISDIGIAFYINKEPGKSLYKNLEKKYKTKGKNSK